MKVEDFAAWLSAISGMSEDQRREAMVALEKASVVGGAAAASAKKGGKRGRQEDALGTTGVERVAAQGCPHCAGREIVGWGRSHGLLRFRCKSCGRTFNTLTKTPMAHLRKKDRWLDHARAMIEGKSLAKTAALCGIHPTTAFRWRHRFLRAPASDKPRGLRGIVEADETFVLEILQGPTVRPAEKGAKADEPFPMVQTIMKFVGDPGLARDFAQLMLEPGPERHGERLALLLAHAATLVGACAPDRLLDRVERGNSLKRLTGDRRFTLGVVEEPAPQVRPAEGERDPAIGRLGGDCLVGGVTVALNNARIIVEQLQAVDRPAAGCIGEGDGRRVRAAPWSIVAGDRPEVALLDAASARIEHRGLRLVDRDLAGRQVSSRRRSKTGRSSAAA